MIEPERYLPMNREELIAECERLRALEVIDWIAVTEKLPDADTTVLVSAPGADEPVWLGYYDGEDWYADTGAEYGNDEEIAQPVTAWAQMPKGTA